MIIIVVRFTEGILGLGIGLSQGLYLPKTAQHRKTLTYVHVSSGIRTHDPSVCMVQDSAATGTAIDHT